MASDTIQIYEKPHVRAVKAFFKWGFLISITLGVSGITAGTWYVNKTLEQLPKIDTQYLKAYDTTKIVDKNGTTIWKSTEKRQGIMTYDQIPELYRDGLIAVEDEDFWTNKGFSYKGLFNMVYSVARSKVDKGYQARGGSTIDQQLIKNVYFDGGVGHSTITRKIQELFLSKQLNENYKKEDILTFYVNRLAYAEGDTGLSAIMMTYFGKKPEDYKERTIPNIAEQAYLIGLGQAPSDYNLYENPEKAHTRTAIVLKVMKEAKLISKAEYQEAMAYDLTTGLKERYWESEQQRVQNLKYKAYTDEVLKEVAEMGYNIDDVTMTIQTFLDPEVYDTITNKVREDQYFQDGTLREEQVAATVMRKDGVVIGMVGSRHEGDELNRAVQQTRSSGSSTKPFTAYGPLLQYFGDQYTTASSFDTSSYVYPGTNSVMYNYGQYTYGVRDIQYSLRMTLNTVVGRIDDQILGSSRMKTFLHGVGLDVKDAYSSVDGIGLNISTLQLAAAYNALNNNGVYVKPRFVNSITFTDKSTKTIEAKQTQAMNPSTAWVLLQMLRGTVTYPYSAKQAAIPQYAGYAGKTGTVALDPSSGAYNQYGFGGSDSWYASVTNEGYAVSVWFGYDEPNSSPQVADDFDGPQWLGRDLQLLLNASNPQATSNWAQPKGVYQISGEGLNAHYGISDSQDVGASSANVEVATIQDYDTYVYTDVKSTSTTPVDWDSKLTGSSKALYELFKANPYILSDTTVISQEVYDLLNP